MNIIFIIIILFSKAFYFLSVIQVLLIASSVTGTGFYLEWNISGSNFWVSSHCKLSAQT